MKYIKLTSYTHFVFSTTESMGREGLTFYYQSVELLSKSDPITTAALILLAVISNICIQKAAQSLEDALMIPRDWVFSVALTYCACMRCIPSSPQKYLAA